MIGCDTLHSYQQNNYLLCPRAPNIITHTPALQYYKNIRICNFVYMIQAGQSYKIGEVRQKPKKMRQKRRKGCFRVEAGCWVGFWLGDGVNGHFYCLGRVLELTFINSMYKVLLRIDKVHLKIKQTVSLHIIIRKQHRYFTLCKNQLLRNGQAKPNNSSQFFIDANNPKFEIEIFLLSGQAKKKGGSVLLNLKNYTINDSHRIVEAIKKTPVNHSFLEIDFVYMASEAAYEEGGLISGHKLEELRHKKHLKEITDKHEKLIYCNQRLQEEIRRLKEKNSRLQRESTTLEEIRSHQQEQYSLQLQKIQQERDNALGQLNQLKQKASQILEKADQAGNNGLTKDTQKDINRGRQVKRKKEENESKTITD